ncbi:agamous-like MADS-box protein AGL97 [Papaver somniferum]|uniref:agamous-like MADS-box protein AGL97 n=1 Tax=Papaver somniferum TaxID=3469 RepID=UPI000E6FD98E|nr:agamous-like MADS-box protein AGL97 [Papaver somniferum]
MGKRKIEIKKIEDKKQRSVSFTKRRNGLFNKAHELCRLTGASISMIVFSPGGKPFTFGCPDEILNRFPANEEEDDDGKRVRSENGDGFWWKDLNMEEVDTLEKVQVVRDQLLQVKDLVNKRKQESVAVSVPPAVAEATSADNIEGSCMFVMEEDEDSSWFSNITFGDNDMEEFDKLFKDFDVEPPLID